MAEGLAEGSSLEKVNRRNDMIYNGSCQHCLLCVQNICFPGVVFISSCIEMIRSIK